MESIEKPRVLVVDDDSSIRRVIQRHLELIGYDVAEARNGIEALQILEADDPPLIITDWLMPEMDGLDLCREIRQREPKGNYHHLIMLTSRSQRKENIVSAIDAGVDDFLSKPPDLMDIKMRLRVARRMLKNTARIETLEQILTICAYTKKIKTADDTWENLEAFLERRLGVQLSHGIEPSYYKDVILPELAAMKDSTELTEESENVDPIALAS